MWQLILVISATINTVGAYDTKAACEADAAQWMSKGITAGCVQQVSPEQAAAKAQTMFKTFAKMIDTLDKE
jgi:hypothetical protein